MATTTKTTRQSGTATNQGGRRRKTGGKRSADAVSRRRQGGNGGGQSYMRSAERLAGQMRSALAEWTAMAADGLPDAASMARGRRSVRAFVQDNAVVLGIAGAGLGVLVGAAIAGGLREPRFGHDDATPENFL